MKSAEASLRTTLAAFRQVDRKVGELSVEGAEPYSEETDLVIQQSNLSRIRSIRAALVSLDNGTYGCCADCGAAIHPARLRILPFATRCIACAAEEEVRTTKDAHREQRRRCFFRQE